MTYKIIPLLALLILFGTQNSAALTYTSNSTAGYWDETSTWNPAGIPADGDDVIITSQVTVRTNHSCRDLTVQSGGELHNNTTHRLLFISGDVVNHGIISDTNWTLKLYVDGNVHNAGIWDTHLLQFKGDGMDHSLESSDGAVLNPDNLELAFGTGTLTIQNAIIMGTVINLFEGQIVCAPGADITMLSGYFIDGSLDAAGNTLDLTDGVYFRNIDLINPVLAGVARVWNDVTMIGTIVVNGTLRNRASTHADVIVDGDIINNGIITDTNWSLDLFVSGSVINSGVWDNHTLEFTGVGVDHDLEGAGGTTLNPDNLWLEAETGTLTLNSAMTFGSLMDLNGGEIVCTAGANITMLSGYLMEGSLVASGNTLNLAEGVYFRALAVSNPVLDGIVRVWNDVTLTGTVVVNGTLRNRASTHADVIVDGDLINNGTITDTNWTLDLFVSGSVINSGVWDNHTLEFTGVGADHDLEGAGGTTLNPDNLWLEAETGTLTLNSAMTLGSLIDLNGGEIVCTAGADITMLSGYLVEGSLVASGNTLDLAEGVYFRALAVSNPVLEGIVRVWNGVTMTGTVVVNGTLRNRASTHADVIVDGDIINNGIITDTNWTLDLFITGNASSHGTWENNENIFNGSTDQYIQVTDEFPLGENVKFESFMTGSPFQWHRSALPIPGETNVNYETGLLDSNSYGHYFCENNQGEHSRIIHVVQWDFSSPAPEMPSTFSLKQNYPNPFNPMTNIAYELAEDSSVKLIIYDVKGRLVKTLVDEFRIAGRHQSTWQGNDDQQHKVAAGVYFSVLTSNEGTISRKLTLVP